MEESKTYDITEKIDVIETVPTPQENIQVSQSECRNCNEIIPTDQDVIHNRNEHNLTGSVRQLSKLVENQVFISSVQNQTEECFVII